MRMLQTVVVAGIGTEVGKTFVSAVMVQLLSALYWKPIQTGPTKDSAFIKAHTSARIIPECCYYKQPVSVHEAGREAGAPVQVAPIAAAFEDIKKNASASSLVIETAGGLLSPLNGQQTNIDLIKALNAPVIVVSRAYLGALNHTLLTDYVLKKEKIQVLGWALNGFSEAYQKDLAALLSAPIVATLAEHTSVAAAVAQWMSLPIGDLRAIF